MSPGTAPGPVSWCLLAALLFGASTPASKALLGALGPVLLSGVLYAGAALFVAPRALADRRGFGGASRRELLQLAGAALFGGVIGPVLLLYGLQRAPAGSVALWLNLETVATALLARVFFREHVGRRAWVAVALVIAASALVSPGADGSATAIALVALACVAWGLDNNLTAVIDRFTPAQVTFVKGMFAAAVNLSIGLHLQSEPIAAWSIAAGLFVGGLSYGVSLLLYVAAAQHLGATRSQLVFSTAPLWGLALSWLALREALGPAHLAAAALMALSLWIWQRERHEHAHAHPALSHRHFHRHDDGHHDHAHESGVEPATWHEHAHDHAAVAHCHPHRPDLHHRHRHRP